MSCHCHRGGAANIDLGVSLAAPVKPPGIPQDVNIEKAIREGFYQCRKCYCCQTTIDVAGVRRCNRCQSVSLRFCVGMDEVAS